MSLFAFVDAQGTITGRREEFTTAPTLAPSKGSWLAVVTVNEAYDALSQVREGPVTTVQSGVVLDTYTLRDKTTDELEAMRQVKRDGIAAEYQRRNSDVIAFTVGGVAKTWDADADALQNIMGVIEMINAGITSPVTADPRTWTAHGELGPTNITHVELKGLGQAIAERKDALFAKKKTLEANLAAITDPHLIDAFDPLAGWA